MLYNPSLFAPACACACARGIRHTFRPGEINANCRWPDMHDRPNCNIAILAPPHTLLALSTPVMSLAAYWWPLETHLIEVSLSVVRRCRFRSSAFVLARDQTFPLSISNVSIASTETLLDLIATRPTWLELIPHFFAEQDCARKLHIALNRTSKKKKIVNVHKSGDSPCQH